MKKKLSLQEAEASLISDLKVFLSKNAILPDDTSERPNNPSESCVDVLTEALATWLQNKGLFSLFGVTAPFHELMLWQKQVTQTISVELVEKTVSLKVVFLEHFLSRGWLGFCTFDVWGSGGWAKTGEIYVVKDAYPDLTKEEFTLSLLKHEA